MSFDPASFEAEVALKLIPTEKLPAVAQDALEAGFEGPYVVRMAILEPSSGWAIDQALLPMMAELGCRSISAKEAALRLAIQRGHRILESGEDALHSIPYFHQLMLAADYPEELIELGYFDDDDFVFFDNLEQKEARAREAVEELVSPELGARRRAERRSLWDLDLTRAMAEWPYVLNSPTGRALLRERYKEKVIEMRPFLWIELVAWITVGWVSSSWRTAVIGYTVTVPVIFALPIWGEYRRMKRERRDLLLRLRVPDDQI